jgi:hypothetical protein
MQRLVGPPGIAHRGRVEAILEQHLVESSQPRHFRHAQPQVVILCEFEALVEEPNLREAVSAKHHRSLAKAIVLQQLPLEGAVIRSARKILQVYRRAGRVNHFHLAAHQADRRVRLEPGHLPRQPRGKGNIIRIVAGDVLTASQGEQSIDRTRNACVPDAANQSYTRISRGEPGENRPRVVSGPVVDDQELQVAERLAQNALGRRFQVRGAVVHAHDDAHQGAAAAGALGVHRRVRLVLRQ